MRPELAFEPFSKEDLERYGSFRPGETRLWQSIHVPYRRKKAFHPDPSHPAPFFVLGIPEDIGPRANLGQGGADSAWEPFLKKFLNLQENRFGIGDRTLLGGKVRTEDLMERAQGLDTDSEEELEKLRELTAELDQRVHPLIRSIVEAGKCPIVIGGGHNNSYGNLRGAYEALRNRKVLDEQAGMACLNIDPHADLRLAEGRHSGNGFTYACDEGYLEYYGIFGLHRNYNPEGILERFDSAPSNFFPTYFDRMLEAGEQDAALLELLGKLEKKERPIGMEIDLDSVAGMAVSAQTPSGFHENDIRRSLLKVLQRKPIAYLHLAEGAPGNKPGYEEHVGKFLAFLVSDAIRNASDPV